MKGSIQSRIDLKLCRMLAALREDYDFVRESITSRVVSLGPWILASLLQNARDDLCGVIHHRDDTGIVEPGRADDAQQADDLLAAVPERSCNHRGAGEREQLVLRAYEDPHPFAAFGAAQQVDHVGLRL